MYKIYDLKCNYMNNPTGLMTEEIEFCWKLKAKENGVRQVVYRIQVWDEGGDCVWDSGEIQSEKMREIRYAGQSLKSHECYSWQVTSTSNKAVQAVSHRASFHMGVLDGRWTGQWLTAPELKIPAYIRREMEVSGPLRKALVYATARGIYQLQIDGQCISWPMAPGYTNYSQFLEVQQYEVTALLGEGCHVIGAILADGWYTGKIGLMGLENQYGDENAFYIQIELFYEDGRKQTIGADEAFRVSRGAYEYADLFIGEKYDASRELKGWMTAGYDAGSWQKPVVKNYGHAAFKGRLCEPIACVHVLKPRKIYENQWGELLIDVGEIIVGYAQISMYAPQGTQVRFEHTETLDREGRFFRNITGKNKDQEDVYIFGEETDAVYEPALTYHGFRYIRVSGISRKQLIDVQIKVIATDLDITGYFECSDERLNQLQENIIRSQRGNMLSVPTDCPQRERAGWTGDMQVYGPTACFNMDVYSFLDRWLMMMRLEQRADGQIPHVIPQIPSNDLMADPSEKHISSAGWADAAVILPYVLYQKYGNRRILEDNYEMMSAWMEYVEQHAYHHSETPLPKHGNDLDEHAHYLWNAGFHFGDWLCPSIMKRAANPVESAILTKEYAATAMYACTTAMMAKISQVLNDRERSEKYRQLNQKIRQAFDEVYIDEDGRLPVELQGVYVLALKMELFRPDKADLLVRHLVELIHQNGDCLDTGFISVPYLLDVLCDYGESELAYTLLYQTKCPSWLYEVEMGATTLWESWDAIREDGQPTETSLNHFAFGCVGDFIYRRILGLNALEPGYEKVLVAPDLQCGLQRAAGTYNSIYGEITVKWDLNNGYFRLDVSLPVNVTGVVRIGGREWMLESGTHCLEISL